MVEIYLIEDEDGLREGLFDGLTSAFGSGRVAAFASVEEAAASLRSGIPKVVVSDIRLPGKSGVEFLQEMRAKHPSVRFILITAFADDKTLENAWYHAFRLLKKPFPLAELLATIEEALRDDFRGRVEGITLVDLVQVACLGRKDLAVHVRSGALEGRIFIESGRIVHAEAGEDEGESAFNRMMGWQSGDFDSRAEVTAPRRTIHAESQHLLLEAMRLLDEQGRSRQASEVDAEEVASEAAPETEGRQLEGGLLSLAALARIEGFLGACLVEAGAGRILAMEGGNGAVPLEEEARLEADLLRAEREAIEAIEPGERVEEVLVTMGRQYQLLRPMPADDRFLVLVIDRGDSNLALARHELRLFTEDLAVRARV